MAQRGKRINRNEYDPASGAVKRRKCKLGPVCTDTPVLVPAVGPSEEEEAMASSNQGGSSWTPRPLNDFKISSIYNRSAAEPPAELYRKDLISAMKLPDSEPLSPSEYWLISDQWKQEWEKGVQVPVNPDSLPEPMVTSIQTPSMSKLYGEFKLPKKFLRITQDDNFNPEDHILSNTPTLAEKACGYDLDDTDITWLEALNGERALCGQQSVTESQLERMVEELEHHCWDKIQTIVKNEEGLGIEFDENVICDVCRSPDSEEGNEMVFCDFCNICVHQACYGITSIPDGSWLCRTCSLGQRPACVLCPNAGGAMKCTRSGQKWAHVSCALWIPEVSIGCVEKMEPITKISSIPASRWALICVLCRERGIGACIQCSIKTCKTAYHVTCAFKHGLEMKAIIEDEQAEDGVKLRSYCQKHGKINSKDKSGQSSSNIKATSDSDEGEVRRRKRKDMSSEEKNQARAAKLQEIEAEFDKHINIKEVIANHQIDIDAEAVIYIYNYWKLKRRAGHNKPLVPPRCGELTGSSMRAQGQAADKEKMDKFVKLRQDLERVRNLCYMVNRREKLKRTYMKTREQTFYKQVNLLDCPALSNSVISAVLDANHGPSIYDHLYSHQDAITHTYDIDSFLTRIKGLESQKTPNSEKKLDFNGASSNPLHFNGSDKKSEKYYGSDFSSLSSTETERPKSKKNTKTKTNKKLHLKKSKIQVKSESSSEEEEKELKRKGKVEAKDVENDNDNKEDVKFSTLSKIDSSKSSKRKSSASERIRMSARSAIDRSSESDSKSETAATRSRTLHHMERELGSGSGSDSDELLPIRNKSSSLKVGPTSVAEIYSDTDDSSLDRSSSKSIRSLNKMTNKTSNNENLRKSKKSNLQEKSSVKNEEKEVKVSKISKDSLFDDIKPSVKSKESKKSTNKKKESIASALIVPQRQAAKKASENMQRSQNKKEPGAITSEQTDIKSPSSNDVKSTSKQSKEYKENKSVPSTTSSKKQKQDCKVVVKQMMKDGKDKDIYDFDKEFGESSEIIAYVPQRQAAKKAAEHIKSNISAKSTVSTPAEIDINDAKLKKESPEIPPTKKKQEIKKEESSIKDEKPSSPKKFSKKTSSNLSSDGSSSSSSSSSGSSDSDSSSDSNDTKSIDKPTRSTAKERSTLTSSSSESDLTEFSSNNSKNTAVGRRQSYNKDSNKSDRAISEKEDKNSSIPSPRRKLKKLPDKKLKTSDGRLGHEFQPPPTERDESTRGASSAYQRNDSLKDVKQHKEQQQHTSKQQSKSSNSKKSSTAEPQQFGHKHQHRPQVEADESLLSGSRDNDGSRNLSWLKSPKSSYHTDTESQQQQQTQCSPFSEIKTEANTTSKRKVSETRKRKSGEVSKKEESTSSKDATAVKKVDKRLSGKTNDKSLSKDQKSSLVEDEALDGESIQKLFQSSKTTSEKNAVSKSRKSSDNKSSNLALEKDSKHGKVEKGSILKLSENIDKSNKKRELTEKSPKAKNIETSKSKSISDTFEKLDRFQSTDTETESWTSQSGKDTKDHKNQIEPLKKNNTLHSDTKKALENKTKHNEPNEKENKRRKSISRSIFSPQHGNKDTGVPELFDFDQDILTDEMVNDDGFSIPRDPEERAPPLSFSFNNELLFKEDPKEDSTRETMNLVEKLRIELSKKSTSSQFDLEPTLDTSMSIDSKVKSHAHQQFSHTDERQMHMRSSVSPDINLNNSIDKADAMQIPDDIVRAEVQRLVNNQKPCQVNKSKVGYLGYVNEDLEKNKVAMADRTKLDRAEADERWVPPSIENLSASDHLNNLIDNQTQRYTGEQVPNDLNNSLITSENTGVTDLQEQYMIRAAAAAAVAAAAAATAQQNIDSHSREQARNVQNLASLVEQQVNSIPTHVLEDLPMEMVNRHLISALPNTGDDSHREPDRNLDKDDLNTDLTRQEYVNSPYNDLAVMTQHQDTRWAESQVLPSRRSTSSSITSTSSVDDNAGIPPYKANNSTSGVSFMNFQPNSVDAVVSSYHPYETMNNYTPPVSLFPPQSGVSQPTYTSSGAGLYPPIYGASFPQPIIPHVSKPLEEQFPVQASPCTAAFTSSSHNMAFTTAMVDPTKIASPPLSEINTTDHIKDQLYHPPNQQDQLEERKEPQKIELQKAQLPIEESSAVAVATAFLKSVTEPNYPLEEPQDHTPSETRQVKNTAVNVGKKSPSKPTRTSARVTLLQAKSPGKSPRQETPKAATNNRSRNRAVKSGQQSANRGRGRGRGRGRAKTSHSSSVHNDDSFQNKFSGTVYDFDSDEDSPSETNLADLRTMRERKKSIELSAVINNESKVDESPSLNSSAQAEQQLLNKNYSEDKRLAASVADHLASGPDSGVGNVFNESKKSMLPVPVDMSTYNSSNEFQSSFLQNQSYNKHLLDSFSGASAVSADLNTEIEEDLDKEPLSAVKQESELSIKGISTFETSQEDSGKHSLIDSRNQLKVKIKGPYCDANYATHSTVTLPLAQQFSPVIPPITNSSVMGSGTSSLRRMRKKELLRQYWSQDMNMDDPANVPYTPNVMPINRNVIHIPKAVSSMISIPTREDYKAVVDANNEKKRRKDRVSVNSLSSFMDNAAAVPQPGDEEQQSIGIERRRSSSGALSGSERRRPRQSRPSTQPSTSNSNLQLPSSGPPKLKIKIGGGVPTEETRPVYQNEDRSSLRPPKKRLSSMPNNPPNMEDVRRENLKYRRMIFANFDDDTEKSIKIKKEKKDKNGKRKKKGGKKEACVELLEHSESAVAPKLIIRLGAAPGSSSIASTTSTDGNTETRLSPSSVSNSENKANATTKVEDNGKATQPKENKQLEHSSVTAVKKDRGSKVSPIRLKLTRCQEGYELKSPGAASAIENQLTDDTKKDLQVSSTVGGEKNENPLQSEKANENLSMLKESSTSVLSTNETTFPPNLPSCPSTLLPKENQNR